MLDADAWRVPEHLAQRGDTTVLKIWGMKARLSGSDLLPAVRSGQTWIRMVPDEVKESPMQIPRPTEADKERFKALVPDHPRVEVKPMFGNLGAFVNGNMFMGLFGPISDSSSTDPTRLTCALPAAVHSDQPNALWVVM
jgi:hypothetical protein